MNNNEPETKQERREKKLRKKQERMSKHGQKLAHIYKEAILKQINKLRREKHKGQD